MLTKLLLGAGAGVWLATFCVDLWLSRCWHHSLVLALYTGAMFYATHVTQGIIADLKQVTLKLRQADEVIKLQQEQIAAQQIIIKGNTLRYVHYDIN